MGTRERTVTIDDGIRHWEGRVLGSQVIFYLLYLLYLQ